MLESKNLDHLGLIASVCEDIGLVDLINKLTNSDPQRKVSVGQCCYAMILNGLGFVNGTLYLTPNFFSDKAVDILFGEGIIASDLNSHSLGTSLDALWKASPSKVFFHSSLQACKVYKIKTSSRHLDGSNLAVHGSDYSNGETGTIELTQGHHKQGRHDLKLFTLELICSNVEGIPLFMESMSGNKTDKTAFPEVLEHYIKEMKSASEDWQSAPYVVDSALYAKTTLQMHNEIKWLSRVPRTIKKAQNEVGYSLSRTWSTFRTHAGYKYQLQSSNYGGVKQQWFIIWSEAAYQGACKTVDKWVNKEKTALLKSAKGLYKKAYETAELAESALKNWYNLLTDKEKVYHDLGAFEIEEVKHYSRGRRKKDSEPKFIDYKIKHISVSEKTSYIEELKQKKAQFILATNELDSNLLDADKALTLYKNEQQKTERGFRFLKDPSFLLDRIFLQLPHRIMALSMIMGLCLLVYTLAQYKLRQALVTTDKTVPNQLGKGIKNPTMKWVFTLFRGIHVGYLKTPEKSQRFVMNLKDVHLNILDLFGAKAKSFYGIV